MANCVAGELMVDAAGVPRTTVASDRLAVSCSLGGWCASAER